MYSIRITLTRKQNFRILSSPSSGLPGLRLRTMALTVLPIIINRAPNGSRATKCSYDLIQTLTHSWFCNARYIVCWIRWNRERLYWSLPQSRSDYPFVLASRSRITRRGRGAIKSMKTINGTTVVLPLWSCHALLYLLLISSSFFSLYNRLTYRLFAYCWLAHRISADLTPTLSAA